MVIGNDTVYTETVNSQSLRLISSGSINVPFVANGTTAAYPDGYCWASSLASIIKYRTTTTKLAVQIRNELLSKGYVCYDYVAKQIMQNYIGGTITLSSGTGNMPISAIQQCIDSSKPIYTDWQNSTGNGAHAMVVRGYYLNPSLIGPGYNYGTATVMDPNQPSYQSVSLIPGVTYKIGTGNYEWYSSVY